MFRVCVALLVSLATAQPGSVVWTAWIMSRANIDVSSNGRFIAVGGSRFSVRDSTNARHIWQDPESLIYGTCPPVYSHDDSVIFAAVHSERTEQLRAFNASDGRVIWRNVLECRTLGRPVLNPNGDVLYITCDEVMAINTRTGGIIWRAAPTNSQFNESSILSRDGTVLFAGNREEFVALDARTGQRVWTSAIGPIRSKGAFSHDQALIYVGVGRDMVALDAKTGRTHWTLQGGSAVYQAHTPAVSSDGTLIFVPGRNEVRAWNVRTQQSVWSQHIMWGDVATDVQLSSDEQHVYFGSEEAGGRFWGLEARTGTQVWRDQGRRPQGGFIVTRDLIFVPGAGANPDGFAVYRQR